MNELIQSLISIIPSNRIFALIEGITLKQDPWNGFRKIWESLKVVIDILYSISICLVYLERETENCFVSSFCSCTVLFCFPKFMRFYPIIPVCVWCTYSSPVFSIFLFLPPLLLIVVFVSSQRLFLSCVGWGDLSLFLWSGWVDL